MCDEDAFHVKKLITSVASSSAAGVAKASPGVVVSGASLFGFTVDEIVGILTIIYLVAMIIGSLPRVLESVRFLRRHK